MAQNSDRWRIQFRVMDANKAMYTTEHELLGIGADDPIEAISHLLQSNGGPNPPYIIGIEEVVRVVDEGGGS